jgi:hypothetical protein
MDFLLSPGPVVAGGFGLTPALLGMTALGIFALISSSEENDDDDSSPGGGLMQPVA